MRRSDMPDWRVMTPSGATTEDEDMEDDELAEEPVIVSKNLAKKRHVVQSPRKKPPISSIGVAKAPKKVKQKATFQRQVSMKSVETPDVSRVSIESHASTAIASTSTTSTLVSSTGALSAASEGEEWISSHLPAKATSSPRQTSIAASSDDRIIFIDDKDAIDASKQATHPYQEWPEPTDEEEQIMALLNSRFVMAEIAAQQSREAALPPNSSAGPFATSFPASSPAGIALPAPFAVPELPPRLRFKQVIEAVFGGDTADTDKAAENNTERESSSASESDTDDESPSASDSDARTRDRARKRSLSEASSAASGPEERKRARTGELPTDDEVAAWLARLYPLIKGKRAVDRADLQAVADAMEEMGEFGKLPWTFLENSGLASAVDRVAQMRARDVPGGDEHGLRRRAGALFDMWTE